MIKLNFLYLLIIPVYNKTMSLISSQIKTRVFISIINLINVLSVIVLYGSSGSPGDYEVDNGDFWCAERSTDC